jgi:flagellar hook protein FlgE
MNTRQAMMRNKVQQFVGQIKLTRFDHPQALTPLGQGIFAATAQSGPPTPREPGEYGTGRLIDGYLEEPLASANPRS